MSSPSLHLENKLRELSIAFIIHTHTRNNSTTERKYKRTHAHTRSYLSSIPWRDLRVVRTQVHADEGRLRFCRVEQHVLREGILEKGMKMT